MRASDVVDAVRAGGWVPLYDPAHDPVYGLVDRHDRTYRAVEAAIWFSALVFDAADFVTTYIGVSHPNITEAVPFSRWVLLTFGWPGLLVEHLLALAVLVVLWFGLPRPYRIVVPGVTALTGYLIINENVSRLLAYGVIDLPW